MEAISSYAVPLSAKESDVVIELLDRERTHLPVEIRHTRTARFREHLKERLEIIETILKRMNAAV